MKIDEAAKYLKVSISTLRRWDKEKILVSEKTSGGHRRYNKEDLDKLKQKQEINNNLDYTTFQNITIPHTHTLALGMDTCENTHVAQELFQKKYNERQPGLCFVDEQQWYNFLPEDTIINYISNPINIFKIPPLYNKNNWATFISDSLGETLDLSVEISSLLHSALITYYKNYCGDNIAELLIILLENLLQNEINYMSSLKLITFLKHFIELENKSQFSNLNELNFSKINIIMFKEKSTYNYVIHNVLLGYFLLTRNNYNLDYVKQFILEDINCYISFEKINSNLSLILQKGRAFSTQWIGCLFNNLNIDTMITKNTSNIILSDNSLYYTYNNSINSNKEYILK